jgi:hypothetical protein
MRPELEPDDLEEEALGSTACRGMHFGSGHTPHELIVLTIQTSLDEHAGEHVVTQLDGLQFVPKVDHLKKKKKKSDCMCV